MVYIRDLFFGSSRRPVALSRISNTVKLLMLSKQRLGFRVYGLGFRVGGVSGSGFSFQSQIRLWLCK